MPCRAMRSGGESAVPSERPVPATQVTGPINLYYAMVTARPSIRARRRNADFRIPFSQFNS